MINGDRALMAAVKQLRNGLLLAFLVAAASNLLALVVPLYNMEAFNRVAGSRNLNTLAWLTVGLLAGMIVYGVLEYVRSALHVGLASAMATRLRLPTLLAAAQGAQAQPSDAGQAVRDLGEIQAFLGGSGLSAPFDLIWSPILIVACFAMHWTYGVVALVCVAILAVLGGANELLS
jgi:ATP-binding cassette, subfamily C, bacterial